MLKRFLARHGARWILSRLLGDADPFHRLLGNAVRLQLGRIGDEEFRERLQQFYTTFDRKEWMHRVDSESLKERLARGGSYKAQISRLAGETPRRFSPWSRRFALLHHLGIRADVLCLRQDEQIPPHGHHRVVSGFYVLEGTVAARNFDRVREDGDRLFVRKTLDRVLNEGDCTTNSEFHQNIHWLLGMAPASYLFRVTVTGVPSATFSDDRHGGERVYIDPRGQPDAAGIINARYVSEIEAKRVPFHEPQGSSGSPDNAVETSEAFSR